MAIDGTDLAGVDLNLLVSLDALLTERSVTRAAARLGVSQPTMSYNLSRLRIQFHDDLLTRSPEGMRPTPRALAIGERLREALAALRGIVQCGKAFDPATSDRSFTVSLPDSAEVLLAPSLMAHLRREAPGIRLLLRTLDRSQAPRELDADRLDLAIDLFTTEGQSHHKRRLLYRDRYVCLYNDALLGVGDHVSLEDYLRFPHVLTSLRGTAHGVVDDALAALGRSRTIALTTPRFLAVPFVVKGSPVMTTMQARLAAYFAGTLGLTVSPAPVDLPEVSVSMLWHASYDADPAHLWLRTTLLGIARQAEPAEA
jgi:LysR family transcriptional activator of mexEF-oprN operon